MMKNDIAPLRGKGINTMQAPWEGCLLKKPWQYRVTAAIPNLDTVETLEIVVELLRLQTEKPYILIIDTGSKGEQLERVLNMHSEDLEVHCLRLNGVEHPSDFPAMAMDVAFALGRTEFMFATHADCFLRKRNFLEELLQIASRESTSVVGYEMSPRAHSDWKGMVSHTATLYHSPTMDKIGFGWSLRRLCNIYNVKDYKPNPLRPNWPDTEILGNYILRMNKIKPYLIGHEENLKRHVDDNIDHIRSYTAGKLYSPSYYETVSKWFKEAKEEAKVRIKEWSVESKAISK